MKKTLQTIYVLIICFYQTNPDLFGHSQVQDTYKLYCCYTPDFEHLYRDWFLPSLKDNFEVIVKTFPQDCPTGTFRQEGFNITMLNKLKMLKDAILEHSDERIFFYSDIDIIFFDEIIPTCLKSIENVDFIAQQGWPGPHICAGFFAMKGNKNTLYLVNQAIDLLSHGKAEDDQDAINKVIRKTASIKYTLLPPKLFPNGRFVLGSKSGFFDENSEIFPPLEMLMFHANCALGLDKKIIFLEKVNNFYRNSHL